MTESVTINLVAPITGFLLVARFYPAHVRDYVWMVTGFTGVCLLGWAASKFAQ